MSNEEVSSFSHAKQQHCSREKQQQRNLQKSELHMLI